MKNMNVIISVLWFVFAFAVTGIISIIFMQNHWLLIFIFSAISLGLIVFFRKEILKLVKDTKWHEVVALIGISLFVHGVTSYFILKYLEQPTWPFDRNGISFLLMNGFYVWAKPIDVMMQQLLIVLLVLRLNSLKMNINQITKLFVVLFGAIHAFQFLRTDFIIGLLYFITSIIFSFVFPKMILRVRNGFIYNLMIHLAVYNIGALLAWMVY
ncbi:MAG: hypothetical protein ABIJ22_04280 [Patescibacteria group bacterium]